MSEKRLDSSELADGGRSSGSSELSQARFDLAASEHALAESLEATAFLQSVLDSSRDCIKVLTLGGDIIFMNDGGKVVMEVDDFETIRGCAWTGFWTGDDKTEAEAALAAARSGLIGNFQGAASTARGNPKFWDVTVTRIPGRKVTKITSYRSRETSQPPRRLRSRRNCFLVSSVIVSRTAWPSFKLSLRKRSATLTDQP